MTAGEHHPELIVFDGIGPKGLFHHGGESPFTFEQVAELGREMASRALAAQNVESPILGSGHKPCRRVLRHTAKFPNLQGAAEGVLYNVLRQPQIMDSENASQGADHTPGLAPEKMLARLH
jgi:hypothetical protein